MVNSTKIVLKTKKKTFKILLIMFLIVKRTTSQYKVVQTILKRLA